MEARTSRTTTYTEVVISGPGWLQLKPAQIARVKLTWHLPPHTLSLSLVLSFALSLSLSGSVRELTLSELAKDYSCRRHLLAAAEAAHPSVAPMTASLLQHLHEPELRRCQRGLGRCTWVVKERSTAVVRG